MGSSWAAAAVARSLPACRWARIAREWVSQESAREHVASGARAPWERKDKRHVHHEGPHHGLPAHQVHPWRHDQRRVGHEDLNTLRWKARAITCCEFGLREEWAQAGRKRERGWARERCSATQNSGLRSRTPIALALRSRTLVSPSARALVSASAGALISLSSHSSRLKCLLRCHIFEDQPVDDQELPMSSGRSYGEARACFPHLPMRPPGAHGRHLLRFAFRPVEVG